MSSFVYTLLVSLVFIFLALLGLGIGLLLTGKMRYFGSRCGYTPKGKGKRDESCGSSQSCSLCGGKDKEEERD